MASEETLVKLVKEQTSVNEKILNQLENINTTNKEGFGKFDIDLKDFKKDVVDKYAGFHKTMIKIEVLMGIIAAAVIGILIAIIFTEPDFRFLLSTTIEINYQ